MPSMELVKFSETQRCENPTCPLGAVPCAVCVIMWFEPANNQRQQFNVVQRKEHLFSSTVLKLGGVCFHTK